jgi:hypothetical protein
MCIGGNAISLKKNRQNFGGLFSKELTFCRRDGRWHFHHSFW